VPKSILSSTRRGFLTLASASAAGLLQTGRAQAATESPAAGTDDACILTPQSEEGPYYLDPRLVRADITEGKAGVPLALRLRVIEAGSCAPISGARVDIWHCNGEGLYSGYANQTGGVDTSGQTFLRGTQFANANGIVEFATIYPGWYRGRTTHIHFKVFLDEKTVLTGQIFFPDALSQYIYQNVEPYSVRGADRDVMNTNDNIAAQATRASFAYVKELEEGLLVAMIIGVDPNAESTGGFGGPPPEGTPPAGN